MSNYKFRYIFIGDSNSGKSSIMKRYVEHTYNCSEPLTLGIEYGIKTIMYDNKNIKLILCDTSGQERFRSITRSYYKNVLGAIIVYDITSRKSFLSLHEWIQDINDNTDNVVMFLVGNKCDLEKRRQVSYDEGLELSKKHNMYFIETSAKNDVNLFEIMDIFDIMTKNIYNKVVSKELLYDVDISDNITIDTKKNISKNCC